MRLTISDETTDEDIDYILEVVPKVVERIRGMSPLWEDIQNGKANIQKAMKFVSPLDDRR